MTTDPDSEAEGLRQAVRAFRHPNFAKFWCGALASNTGTWIQNLAVPFVLFEFTDSVVWTALSVAAQFGPLFVFAPLAGSLADRFDRRMLLIVNQTALACAAILLWLAWVLDVASVGLILVLVSLGGVIQGLGVPAWQSFVSDLVPRADLQSAVALNSLQFNASRALGPAVAGLVIATIGVGWAFLINALSFLAVLLAIATIRGIPRQAERRIKSGVLGQFGAALRYTVSQPGIVAGIAVAIAVGMLGNPVFQFTIVFAEDVYDVGPLGLGLLNGALGLGVILAAPLASGWSSVVSRSTLTTWGLGAQGAGILLFALSTTYVIGLVALVVVGGAFLVCIASSNTAVQTIVADYTRGRVLAIRLMAYTGAYPLGALIQGWASDSIGPRVTVSCAGGLMLGIALWCFVAPAAIRRLDDPHDESTGDHELREPDGSVAGLRRP